MKVLVFVTYLILCPFFLACLWPTDAGALTCLAQSKTVAIDENWQITGRYTYNFEISGPEDARKINGYIHQLTSRPTPVSGYSVTIQGPDGREISLAAMNIDHPAAGTSMKLAFAVSKTFPGFEGLFADTLHIHQATPVREVTYHIAFPEKTTFVCEIRRDHPSDTTTQQNSCFSDVFSWSGHNVSSLDLKISTAASWDIIKDRYQTNFQKRIKNGSAAISLLPGRLADFSPDISCSEKINRVMNFVRNTFDYQRHARNGHCLLPDAPATVIHRGWGDCKDITLVATLLLQSMGIDAFVVLEGDRAAHFPGAAIPDPFIFDHAMVGTRANGRVAYHDCFSPKNTVAANDRSIYLHLEVPHDAQ